MQKKKTNLILQTLDWVIVLSYFQFILKIVNLTWTDVKFAITTYREGINISSLIFDHCDLKSAVETIFRCKYLNNHKSA